jgi:hypothetical protein
MISQIIQYQRESVFIDGWKLKIPLFLCVLCALCGKMENLTYAGQHHANAQRCSIQRNHSLTVYESRMIALKNVIIALFIQ